MRAFKEFLLKKTTLLPFGGGLLYALGFPSAVMTSFPIGPILGIGLYLWALEINERRTLKNEILITLIFCFSYNMLGFYWIPFTIKTYGFIPFPLNYLLGVFFSLIIAPQLLVFVLLRKAWQWKGRKIKLLQSPHVSTLSMAVILTLLEYWTPQQFPAHMGHPWIILAPYLSLAKVFGYPLFSFLGFWMAATVPHLMRRKEKLYLPFVLFLVIIVINLLNPLQLNQEVFDKTNFRLVQANIGNYLKLKSEEGDYRSVEQVVSFYYQNSVKPSDEELDLIIWPETAFPHLIVSDLVKDNPGFWPNVFRDIQREMNAELFFGGYDQRSLIPSDFQKLKDTQFENEFNSAFHIGPYLEFKNVYHKMKLLPFGETLPMGTILNKYLKDIINNISYFGVGSTYQLFQLENGSHFISAICYEILFPEFIRTYLSKTGHHPNMIINLTNDSWFGETMEPFQHLFLAKWRAIEFQLPLIRSTNTGITSMILEDGSESERIGMSQRGYLDLSVDVAKRRPTIFQNWGTIPLLLLMLGLFPLSILIDRRLFKTSD